MKWAVAVMAARVGGLSLSALDIRANPDQSMPMSAAARVALMTGDPYVSPLVDGPVWDEVERIEGHVFGSALCGACCRCGALRRGWRRTLRD